MRATTVDTDAVDDLTNARPLRHSKVMRAVRALSAIAWQPVSLELDGELSELER